MESALEITSGKHRIMCTCHIRFNRQQWIVFFLQTLQVSFSTASNLRILSIQTLHVRKILGNARLGDRPLVRDRIFVDPRRLSSISDSVRRRRRCTSTRLSHRTVISVSRYVAVTCVAEIRLRFTTNYVALMRQNRSIVIFFTVLKYQHRKLRRESIFENRTPLSLRLQRFLKLHFDVRAPVLRR